MPTVSLSIAALVVALAWAPGIRANEPSVADRYASETMAVCLEVLEEIQMTHACDARDIEEAAIELAALEFGDPPPGYRIAKRLGVDITRLAGACRRETMDAGRTNALAARGCTWGALQWLRRKAQREED